jgi:hypothetical protein
MYQLFLFPTVREVAVLTMCKIDCFLITPLITPACMRRACKGNMHPSLATRLSCSVAWPLRSLASLAMWQREKAIYEEACVPEHPACGQKVIWQDATILEKGPTIHSPEICIQVFWRGEK